MIAELMTSCGLDKFLNSLSVDAHWGQILSPGEQQRVGWVRAFLREPSWLFLYEATSALDETMQDHLYSEIDRRLHKTTVVSVAHRSELSKYHHRVLDMKADRA